MAFFGICYSPYHHGGSGPSNKGPVTEQNVRDDMQLIQNDRRFEAIRTYDVSGGDQWNVKYAVETAKMKYLGVGVSVSQISIDTALSQVEQVYTLPPYKGTFTCDLVIGNEVDLQGPPQGVLDVMSYARSERDTFANIHIIPPNTKVTTCITVNALAFAFSLWSGVVAACEGIVYVTVYPYLDPKGPPPPDNIDAQMNWAWNEGLSRVTKLGKQVVIAEIGWPTFDKMFPNSATPANQKTNYATTQNWVSNKPKPNIANRPFDTFWFEMFDEPWKTAEPRGYGPYWGLYDKDGKKKWT